MLDKTRIFPRIAKQEKTQKVILMASTDPHILERNVTDTMNLYSISHASVLKAIDLALKKESDKTGKAVYVIKQELDRKKSLMGTLTFTEGKYPGLVRLIESTKSMAKIGMKYKISRQRIHQIKNALIEYQKMFPNITINTIIKGVERTTDTPSVVNLTSL